MTGLAAHPLLLLTPALVAAAAPGCCIAHHGILTPGEGEVVAYGPGGVPLRLCPACTALYRPVRAGIPAPEDHVVGTCACCGRHTVNGLRCQTDDTPAGAVTLCADLVACLVRETVR